MPRLTPQQRDTVVRRYIAGEHAPALAEEVGCSVSNVRALVLRRGHPTRSIGHTVRARRGIRVDEHAFDKATPDRNYWAGFLLADGCISDKGRLNLTLALKDVDHVESLRSFLGLSTPLRHQAGRGVGLAVQSARMAADLNRLGIVPRKSLTASCPEELLMDRDFWRGVVDGDGSVAITREGYPQVVLFGAQALLEAFAEFGRRHAPGAPLRLTNHSSIFRVGTVGSKAIPIIRALYEGAGVALGRKAETAAKILKGH